MILSISVFSCLLISFQLLPALSIKEAGLIFVSSKDNPLIIPALFLNPSAVLNFLIVSSDKLGNCFKIGFKTLGTSVRSGLGSLCTPLIASKNLDRFVLDSILSLVCTFSELSQDSSTISSALSEITPLIFPNCSDKEPAKPIDDTEELPVSTPLSDLSFTIVSICFNALPLPLPFNSSNKEVGLFLFTSSGIPCSVVGIGGAGGAGGAGGSLLLEALGV